MEEEDFLKNDLVEDQLDKQPGAADKGDDAAAVK